MKLKFLHKTPTVYMMIFLPYCMKVWMSWSAATQKLIKKKIYGALKLKNTQ